MNKTDQVKRKKVLALGDLEVGYRWADGIVMFNAVQLQAEYEITCTFSFLG